MAIMPAKPAGPASSGLLNMYANSLNRRPLRYNQALDKLGNRPLVQRVPRDVLADEHNVVLGFPRLAVGAGATVAFTTTPPRDVIIRDMVFEEVLLAVGVVGARDYTLQAFTVEGNALSLAIGAPIGAFAPTARNRPSIDLPATGGTPVTATWINNSAVPGVLVGALYID